MAESIAVRICVLRYRLGLNGEVGNAGRGKEDVLGRQYQKEKKGVVVMVESAVEVWLSGRFVEKDRLDDRFKMRVEVKTKQMGEGV